MRAVDTNVLLRMLLRDDAAQLQAADAFAAGGAWIPLLVLAETAWVLQARGWRKPVIAAAVEMLLRHETLAVEDPERVGRALAQFRLHPGVEFADCLILESARDSGHLPLGTFDRRLGRLPGAMRLG